MSAVNNFRDTTDADILNKLRQDIESAKAGNTSQNNFTLNYISPNADTIDITDSITVNGTLQSVSDTIDITDSVSQTNVNTGLFQVEDDSSYQKLMLSFDNDYVDVSGNKNAGTLTGTETYVNGAITYSDGRTNKAFSFNGSSSVNFPSNSGLNPTGAVSITGWLYLPTTSGGDPERDIITKFGQYMLRVDANSEASNRLAWFVWTNNSGVQTIHDRLTYTYTPNTWFHFCALYEQSSGRWELWVNTVLQSSSTIGGSLALWTSTSALGIGSSGDGVNAIVKNGSRFDDIQIWNY